MLLTMFPLLPWIAIAPRWCWSLALPALWLHCIFLFHCRFPLKILYEQILEPSKMLHQWRRPRLSEFRFPARSRSFSPTALAARGGDTVMRKFHVLSGYTDMIYQHTVTYLSMSIFDGSLDQLFSGMISWLHVWCDAGLWTCAVASSGGQVTCMKIIEVLKALLERRQEFCWESEGGLDFPCSWYKYWCGFQVQVVLSSFHKGSLHNGRIQNFPKQFAPHGIRQVASEALST